MTKRTWSGRVFIGISLDGYIAKPDDDIEWLTKPSVRNHVPVDGGRPALIWETFFPDIDTILMGRRTYETIAGFDEWPFPDTRVIVLSSTLSHAQRAEIAPSLSHAQDLLNQYGSRQVYVDGGKTIQAFLRAGLIDEITVSIAPVLIGGGARLFGDLDEDVLLTLRGVHSTADDGLVRITYDVHREA